MVSMVSIVKFFSVNFTLVTRRVTSVCKLCFCYRNIWILLAIPTTPSIEIATMKFSDLQHAVRTAAAIRCRTRLQPAGGEGDKVFPPTYLSKGK